MIRRFPKVRSVELKGKPHFADFNLVPDGWGGYVYPWIEAMSSKYTWLKEIRLKRMVVTDECLELIAKSFRNFKVLVCFLVKVSPPMVSLLWLPLVGGCKAEYRKREEAV